VRRSHESDWAKAIALAAGPDVVRESSAADPVSRWLEVSIVRQHVEPGSPSQTVSQPFGDDSEENLITVCSTCHASAHGQTG
jgi:hypothetical protein